MTNILVFSDSHLSSKQPINRLDNIEEVNEQKIERMIHVFNDFKCSFTICDGDLFNSWAPDNKAIKLLSRYISKTGAFYLLPGNHDLPAGGNIFSFEDTILSAIMDISTKIRVFGGSIVVEDVELIPINYTREFSNFFIFTKIRKDTIVAFAHLLIGNNNRYTKPEDIVTNANIFITAHVHEPIDIITKGARFVCLGPVVRRRITEKNHIPQVGILQIDGKKVNLKKIKLNAPDANFRDAPQKEEEFALKDIEKLVESALKIDEDLTIKELIRIASTKLNLQDEAAFREIETVIEEIKGEKHGL